MVIATALRAQLVPPLEPLISTFSWMRRTRHDSEYPSINQPVATITDVDDALPQTEELLQKATVLVGTMPVY